MSDYYPIDDPHPDYWDCYGVEMSDDDGSRSFARGSWGSSLSGAIRRAGEILEGGDVQGKMWQHVEVIRFQYATCVKTTVIPMEEGKDA